jgi:hypothetical protein
MHTVRHASDEVAQWITDYLARHPDAADAAEGVQRWWLAPRHGEIALEVVRQALEALERSGLVSSRSIAGRMVYGRGPALPGQP